MKPINPPVSPKSLASPEQALVVTLASRTSKTLPCLAIGLGLCVAGTLSASAAFVLIDNFESLSEGVAAA